MTTDNQAFDLVPADGLRLSFTPIRDWTMLHPELRGTPFQLYAIMRSLVIDKAGNRPSRRITIDQLCWLLPGINDKPTSETAVKDALKVLDRLGLVTNPDSERLVTSTGRGGIEIRRRFQINDLPPEGFRGWRNAWDKLDNYHEGWRTHAPKPPAIGSASGRRANAVDSQGRGPDPDPTGLAHPFEGRNSDPRSDQAEEGKTAGRFKGRNSDDRNRNSGVDHRNSDRSVPSDQPKRAPKKSLKEGSLSTGATAAPDADPTDPGERELLNDPNAPDPAAPIVEAWAEAWAKTHAGSPPPALAPGAVRRSARKLLSESVDAELLRMAASNMATHGWTDLRKHLERWAPPTPRAPHAPGTPPQPIADCPWCDEFGWYEPEPGRSARCKHPAQPPAGHPAAAHAGSMP